MPMYQYTCTSCSTSFEKQLRMTQAGENQICPQCGSKETRKRIGNVAFSAGTKGPALNARPPNLSGVSSPFS